jgi:hypothetical protein
MEYWFSIRKLTILILSSIPLMAGPLIQYSIIPERVTSLFHYSSIPIGAKPLSFTPSSPVLRKRLISVGDIGVFGFIQGKFFALANIFNPVGI